MCLPLLKIHFSGQQHDALRLRASLSHSPGFDIPSIIWAARNIILLPEMSTAYECVISHEHGWNILPPRGTERSRPWLVVLLDKVGSQSEAGLCAACTNSSPWWNPVKLRPKLAKNEYRSDLIRPLAMQPRISHYYTSQCKADWRLKSFYSTDKAKKTQTNKQKKNNKEKNFHWTRLWIHK